MREGGCEMLRGFLCAALMAASATSVGAQVWPPRLVGSFAAPTGSLDVAYENRGLFVLVNAASPAVCRFSTSGSLLGSFSVPVPSGARGITYDGSSLTTIYISNRINGYIYKFTTAGSLTGSFRCPAGAPYGLGFTEIYNPHGRGLFAACRDAGYIARLDTTTGSLLSTFAGPAAAVITYDDFFAGVRSNTRLYWDYYGSWQILDTLPANVSGIAAGVMWPIDQTVYLFVLCANEYVYYYFGWTAVAPASLGRVKALFR
jgi:hypothetical protein